MNDFFSQLYELFGFCYFDGFSDDLFNAGIYPKLGLSTLLFSLLMLFVFYFLKSQKPLTYRLLVWLIAVSVFCALSFSSAFGVARKTLSNLYEQQNQEMPYEFWQFASFAFINLLWALIFCTIISVVIQFVFINTHGNVPFRLRKSHK